MKEWTIIISLNRKNYFFKINEKLYLSFLILFGIFSSIFLYLNIEGYKKRFSIVKVEILKRNKKEYVEYIQKLNNIIELVRLDSESSLDKTLFLSNLVEKEIQNNFNKNMGVGGFFEKVEITDPKISRDIENLFIEKEKIKNLVDFQFETTEKLKKRFNEKEAIVKATPSIWPAFGYITASFGERLHPFYRKREFHKGIDIANIQGTFVYSTAYGQVKFAGWKDGYGKTIIIEHGFGYSTKYAHLKDIYVKQGTYVKRGQLIGAIGSTGLATGPHLHYEVLISNNPVNPFSYLENSKNTY